MGVLAIQRAPLGACPAPSARTREPTREFGLENFPEQGCRAILDRMLDSCAESDIANLAGVCARLKTAVYNNEEMWKTLARRRWASPDPQDAEHGTWRSLVQAGNLRAQKTTIEVTLKESELFSKSTSRHVFTLAGRRFILTARAEAPPPIEWDRKTQGPQPWRPHVLTARVDLLPQGVSERSALPGMEKTHEERAKQRLQLQALDTPRGSESGASQGTPTKLFRKRSKTTVALSPDFATAPHGHDDRDLDEDCLELQHQPSARGPDRAHGARSSMPSGRDGAGAWACFGGGQTRARSQSACYTPEMPSSPVRPPGEARGSVPVGTWAETVEPLSPKLQGRANVHREFDKGVASAAPRPALGKSASMKATAMDARAPVMGMARAVPRANGSRSPSPPASTVSNNPSARASMEGGFGGPADGMPLFMALTLSAKVGKHQAYDKDLRSRAAAANIYKCEDVSRKKFPGETPTEEGGWAMVSSCHLFSENTPTLRLTNVAPVVQTEEFHTALFRKSPVGGTIVKLQLSALVCEAPEAARVVSEAGEVLSQAARRGAYEAITGRVGDVVLSGSAKETKTPSTLASENGSREEGSSVRDHALEAPDLARDMHAQFALSGMAADAGGYGSGAPRSTLAPREDPVSDASVAQPVRATKGMLSLGGLQGTVAAFQKAARLLIRVPSSNQGPTMRSVDCGNNHPMGVPFLDGEQPLLLAAVALALKRATCGYAAARAMALLFLGSVAGQDTEAVWQDKSDTVARKAATVYFARKMLTDWMEEAIPDVWLDPKDMVAARVKAEADQAPPVEAQAAATPGAVQALTKTNSFNVRKGASAPMGESMRPGHVALTQPAQRSLRQWPTAPTARTACAVRPASPPSSLATSRPAATEATEIVVAAAPGQRHAVSGGYQPQAPGVAVLGRASAGATAAAGTTLARAATAPRAAPPARLVAGAAGAVETVAYKAMVGGADGARLAHDLFAPVRGVPRTRGQYLRWQVERRTGKGYRTEMDALRRLRELLGSPA